MKSFIIFLTLLTLLPVLVLSTECVVGIDDYCQQGCELVDHDCLSNPDVATQDVSCTSSPDGYCDERCLDSDWDCLVNTTQTTIVDPFLDNRILQEQEGSDRVEEESFLQSVARKATDPWIIGLIIMGKLLLMMAILLLFHRHRQNKNFQKYAHLIPFVQHALEHGYSRDEIHHGMKSRGYEDHFIKGLFRALEHRP